MIKSKNILLDKALVDKDVKFLAPSVNPKTATVTARTADATLNSEDFNAITTNSGDN
jgi:hypothetical protein